MVEHNAFSQTVLPVCLGNGKPNSLVSLWDMYQIAANNLVHIGRILQSLIIYTKYKSADDTLSPQEHDELVGHLGTLLNHCEAVTLVATRDMVAWTLKRFRAVPPPCGQISEAVEYLSASFQQELSRTFFAYIDPDKAKYIQSVEDAIRNPPYGQDAAQAFPYSLRDMEMAGSCFACGFNDACVFHLMRVLEKSLGALAAVFNEPFQHQNWHNVIQRLQSQITKIDPSFASDWKTKQQFYSEAACEFMFFKDAWRNHVMHGREEYDTERTTNIYNHVCVFMKLLAQGGLKQE